MRRSLYALCTPPVLLIAAAHAPALAQSTPATLKGRLIDTAGEGLPAVPLQISSKSQPSGNKSALTDIEGNFRVPLLPPANDYFIKVDYPGFATIELGPLDLDPGKITVQDVTLRSTTELSETINVEARGNTVDVESTRTSTNFNSEFIEGLPIIGHNFQDILV